MNEPDFVNASLEYHRAEQALLIAEQNYQEAHEAHRMAAERLNEAHRAAMADIKDHDAWARTIPCLSQNRNNEAQRRAEATVSVSITGKGGGQLSIALCSASIVLHR